MRTYIIRRETKPPTYWDGEKWTIRIDHAHEIPDREHAMRLATEMDATIVSIIPPGQD